MRGRRSVSPPHQCVPTWLVDDKGKRENHRYDPPKYHVDHRPKYASVTIGGNIEGGENSGSRKQKNRSEEAKGGHDGPIISK